MEYIDEKTYGRVKVVENKAYKWGVTDLEGNIIVPFGKYGWIDGFDQGLARVRTDKNPGFARNIVAVFGDEGVITDKQAIAESIEQERREHPEAFAKWGIINEKGEEVLPLEYDNIWNFKGKNRYSTRVEKGGEAHEVYLRDLNPELPPRGKQWRPDYYSLIEDNEDYEPRHYEEPKHYEEFAGTYAQDVAGYSDEEIYDIFGGEPDAYWNID